MTLKLLCKRRVDGYSPNYEDSVGRRGGTTAFNLVRCTIWQQQQQKLKKLCVLAANGGRVGIWRIPTTKRHRCLSVRENKPEMQANALYNFSGGTQISLLDPLSVFISVKIQTNRMLLRWVIYKASSIVIRFPSQGNQLLALTSSPWLALSHNTFKSARDQGYNKIKFKNKCAA